MRLSHRNSVGLHTKGNLGWRKSQRYEFPSHFQDTHDDIEERQSSGAISGLTFEVTIWNFVTCGHLPGSELVNWEWVTFPLASLTLTILTSCECDCQRGVKLSHVAQFYVCSRHSFFFFQQILRQIRRLQQRLEILACTPGRVITISSRLAPFSININDHSEVCSTNASISQTNTHHNFWNSVRLLAEESCAQARAQRMTQGMASTIPMVTVVSTDSVGPGNANAATASVLTDNVLLEIFGFCQEPESDNQSLYYVWEWQLLAQVCRRWRQIIFASPCRLNLQLLCKEGTPVRKYLGIWPVIPILMQYGARIRPSDEDNVIAALEHPDRVCRLGLSVTGAQLAKMSAEIPFPVLTHLSISSECETGLVNFGRICTVFTENRINWHWISITTNTSFVSQ